MTAKQYLSRARSLDWEIDTLLLSKQSAFDSVTRITQNYDSDGASSTKDPHKYDSLVELEERIDRKIDEYINAMEEILQTIQQVPDARQRNVLRLYYTVKDKKTKKPLTWEQVAVRANYSYKQTKRHHARGLAAVDRILETCP